MTHPGRMLSHQSASSCSALLLVIVDIHGVFFFFEKKTGAQKQSVSKMS